MKTQLWLYAVVTQLKKERSWVGRSFVLTLGTLHLFLDTHWICL